MEKSVYLDTTIFSFYFDSRPDSLYRQKITIEWWKTQRKNYNLYTSYFTVKELNNPVYPNWGKVSELVQDIPILRTTNEIKGIIRIYMENDLMPKDDTGDAAHLAIASYHSVDYLLINMRLGLVSPDIITPEQLFRETDNV